MDASLPKIRRLRATPVNVPLTRPHPTASGVVSSAPLVLMDLETDQGLTGHAYVFCYTSIALKPIAELIEALQPLIQGTVIADFFARTLEHEPSRGSLTLVEEIGFHIGGAVPNTGAVLARLRVSVSLMGRIENDQFGSFVRQQLEKWTHTVTLAVDLQRPGRIANATGALAVTKQGATEGVDSWDQVLALLEREKSPIS